MNEQQEIEYADYGQQFKLVEHDIMPGRQTSEHETEYVLGTDGSKWAVAAHWYDYNDYTDPGPHQMLVLKVFPSEEDARNWAMDVRDAEVTR